MDYNEQSGKNKTQDNMGKDQTQGQGQGKSQTGINQKPGQNQPVKGGQGQPSQSKNLGKDHPNQEKVSPGRNNMDDPMRR